MSVLDPDDPVVGAVRTGDVTTLRTLLQERHGVATARLRPPAADCGPPGPGRSLLHVATDWPGHRPGVAATIAALVEAGADLEARFDGETALHWAASSDDLEALDALLDAGADIEATGAVIAGGTPLQDAVAFGQWRAARRLVERGAATALREAAALGLLDRVDAAWSAVPAPSPPEVTEALWYACHGGQQAVAAALVDRGGDLRWVAPWDGSSPVDAAERSGATELVAWLRTKGAPSAAELSRGR